MPNYGFGATALGAGAQAGLQELLKQRLLERQMALQEQAQRENSAYRNRALDEQMALRKQVEAQNAKMDAFNLADREQAGLERFAAKDVTATPVGSSITPERADLWSEGGQGGVVRNALQGTVTDPAVGGERPAMALFRGYTAPEAEKVNAYAQQESDRDENARQRAEDQRMAIKLAASLRQPAGVGSSLTPGGLDVAATQYAQTGQMPPLGMGSSGMRSAIINRAAELFPDLNIAASAADYRSNLGSLSQLTKRYNAVNAYAKQASMSLDNAMKASGEVIRTGAPLVNRYKNWVTKNITGGAPLSKFEVFVYNAARDYARVTSGGAESVAQMTDAANAAADALLNTAQNPEQFAAALQAMQADMRNVTSTLADQIQSVRGKTAARPGEMPVEAPGVAPPVDIEWVRDPKTGKLVKKGG